MGREEEGHRKRKIDTEREGGGGVREGGREGERERERQRQRLTGQQADRGWEGKRRDIESVR